MMEKHVNLTGD